MKVALNLFDEMISLVHIFNCWNHFIRGKRKRKDIQCFERDLEDNIFQLHQELVENKYRHAPYSHFHVTDPKQRYISKASVRDRLVHQIVYEALTTVFDKKFIFHSLSSRAGKGTHIGISLLRSMIRKVSINGTKPCYGLKMDIKHFFDSINHYTLKALIRKNMGDENALKVIDIIIDSFQARKDLSENIGIPLGNATSQIFANIYLDELDKFIKHTLCEHHYLRYCDDFIILSGDKIHLQSLIIPIREFLITNLQLELHPKKLTIRKLNQGIDFVGYVLFSKYTLLRVRTKQRMKNRLKEAHANYLLDNLHPNELMTKLQSYLGILSHANQYTLAQALKNAYWSPSQNSKKNQVPKNKKSSIKKPSNQGPRT